MAGFALPVVDFVEPRAAAEAAVALENEGRPAGAPLALPTVIVGADANALEAWRAMQSEAAARHARTRRGCSSARHARRLKDVVAKLFICRLRVAAG